MAALQMRSVRLTQTARTASRLASCFTAAFMSPQSATRAPSSQQAGAAESGIRAPRFPVAFRSRSRTAPYTERTGSCAAPIAPSAPRPRQVVALLGRSWSSFLTSKTVRWAARCAAPRWTSRWSEIATTGWRKAVTRSFQKHRHTRPIQARGARNRTPAPNPRHDRARCGPTPRPLYPQLW